MVGEELNDKKMIVKRKKRDMFGNISNFFFFCMKWANISGEMLALLGLCMKMEGLVSYK